MFACPPECVCSAAGSQLPVACSQQSAAWVYFIGCRKALLIAVTLFAEQVERATCPGLLLYAPPGQRRVRQVLLDGKAVEPRVVDVEAYLCRRTMAPHCLASAGIVYQLGLSLQLASGNLRRRAEVQGQTHFVKVGCITGTSWLARGFSATLPEAEWAASAVAHADVQRVAQQPLWQQLCGGVTAVRSLRAAVVAAKVVQADSAAEVEALLGREMQCLPGVMRLVGERWRPAPTQVSFWHFTSNGEVQALLFFA